MKKIYQIFVSSTYLDLIEERRIVMEALLELDFFPRGMELFPAADEDQWTLIKRVIDECDYYVVIVGGKYGSIGVDGKSYTQMEYEYAISKNKPVLAFLHRNPESLPNNKCEISEDNRRKLGEFRSFARKKCVSSGKTQKISPELFIQV